MAQIGSIWQYEGEGRWTKSYSTFCFLTGVVEFHCHEGDDKDNDNTRDHADPKSGKYLHRKTDADVDDYSQQAAMSLVLYIYVSSCCFKSNLHELWLLDMSLCNPDMCFTYLLLLIILGATRGLAIDIILCSLRACRVTIVITNVSHVEGSSEDE